MGNAAPTEAEMTGEKATPTHRDCTLTAIALFCPKEGVEDVHVAVGIPVKDWELVDKRNAYKDFMLPDGEARVRLKTKSDGPAEDRRFVIRTKKAFPESQGALYAGDPREYADDMVAVVDIGGLNVNATIWSQLELDRESAITDELGGGRLVTGLAQALTSELGARADERVTMRALLREGDERALKPRVPDPELERRSREVIDAFLLDHARRIRQDCNARRWPLEYMQMLFIGGTSRLLRKEIAEVFGEGARVADDPEFANALGFLRILGAQCGLPKLIPLPKK